jgi:hypothetical protein
MKPGDLVRLRKSHPAVKRWGGYTTIKKWANAGVALLLVEKCSYSDTRWEVIGPDGETASFDDFLFKTPGTS